MGHLDHGVGEPTANRAGTREKRNRHATPDGDAGGPTLRNQYHLVDDVQESNHVKFMCFILKL